MPTEQREINRPGISLVVGDITRERADALVNAADSSLLGGGGVDGAIHRAAGPQLLWECRAVAPCPAGEARVTKAYNLPAKWVIHAVGPLWRGGRHGEPEILSRAYRSALAAAERLSARSVAFSAIGTGAYGYPAHRAAEVAVREVRAHLARGGPIESVRFVCFTPDVHAAYEAELAD